MLYDDYEKVKRIIKPPLREIHKYANIRKKYKSMFKHLDRHHNEIVFIKCRGKSCCAGFHSLQLLDILKSWEFKILAPTPDETCKNHYNTFISRGSVEKKLLGDDGQLSVLRKDIGSCKHCKSYVLTSKTEK